MSQLKELIPREEWLDEDLVLTIEELDRATTLLYMGKAALEEVTGSAEFATLVVDDAVIDEVKRMIISNRVYT